MPAFSQDWRDHHDWGEREHRGGGDDFRDSEYGRHGHDFDEMMSRMEDEGSARRMRRGNGFGFFMRHGDAVVAVRCDPNDSMKACVEATTTLLEKARSAVPPAGGPGTPPGTPTPSRP